MRRRWLIVLLVGLGGGGILGGFLIWRGRGLEDRILVFGNVEATEVEIAFKVSGRIVELPVREGEMVRRGAVLARLDRETLERQRDRAVAALRIAESQVAQLRTAIAHLRETVEAQIVERQAALEQAEAQLRELLAGSRTQEIEQARAAVQAARAEWERAQRDWERARTLYERDEISTAHYDQARTRYEQASAQLQQAEQRLALLLEGPRREQIEAARAQVARARAAMRQAEAQRLEVRRREQELAMREAERERARAELALIETQLREAVVTAPFDGIVLTKVAEVGEVVAAGATILTLGDLRRPWVRAYIGERDLGRVKLGARVRVTTDSFPDRIYWGRVSFIASEAEFTPKPIQTPEERVRYVYRIKIEVENPNLELKVNMPVTAEILLERP
ncbi:MAG: HlyD family efflux transporter periplasmic adaptor subunit [Blastocatellia bacterium]|nr:HlyD family efflux transporter periplasmic adaptor subunit [Blastocatellia bacterium]MCS7156213.1 HlyD family efflux transporter periplasmic adaptor subunit [Blastocatellia bacterium]MCX7751437.1 HlyD family efflux transporter periplasmic adaptor subunit [Blastocatellia bacterium]MDW8169150.1 HlyD family efflux transporter periplasmic adaptor subunit [Acidobacteriota bacterium]MDW8256011.1 HlyD family efflux transporter periplasmic adaptor subunit [Acidobacteriota bacterium]